MRFLADMGVSQTVCRWLRQQGHDVVHLRDEGLQRLPNGQIFLKAASEQRIVLTFDLDFGEIVANMSDCLTSVIIVRLRNARSNHVVDRLEAVLRQSAAAFTNPIIVTVEEGRHRIRRLPITE